MPHMPLRRSTGDTQASGAPLGAWAENAEYAFSAAALPQLQLSGSAAEPMTSTSNAAPQSAQRYSKIGMSLF